MLVIISVRGLYMGPQSIYTDTKISCDNGILMSKLLAYNNLPYIKK